MPLQAVLADDPKQRRFNAERDLAWILPRLITRALQTFTAWEDSDLKKLLDESHINVDSGRSDFEELIHSLTDYLAACVNSAASRQEVSEKLALVYQDKLARIRLLVFDRLVKVILAEYAVWCEQIRPTSALPARPSVAELEQLKDEILARVPE